MCSTCIRILAENIGEVAKKMAVMMLVLINFNNIMMAVIVEIY